MSAGARRVASHGAQQQGGGAGGGAGDRPRPGEVVVGLDVGEARIGAARGVVGSPYAFGRGALPGRDHQAAVTAIGALLGREGAARLVIGLPLRTDGSDSRQTSRVRELAARLGLLGVPIELVDERFTTQAAERALRGSGLPRGKRRQKVRVDEASAVLILETYLARFAGALGTEATDGPGEP